MSQVKKIERLLRQVPELAVPEDLGARLRACVAIPSDTYPHSGVVRRSWFAPYGGAVSWRRVACAAGLVAACLASLGFGTSVILRQFVLREYQHVYKQETSAPASGPIIRRRVVTATYGSDFSVTGDGIRSDEDARLAEKEMIAWIRAGKAREVERGRYEAVLPRWGAVVYETRGLPRSIVIAENRDEKIREMYDEIERLRQAGQFVSVLDKVEENPDGSKTYYYYVHYTLSSGETMTLYNSRRSPE